MNLIGNVECTIPSHWLWEIGVDEYSRTRTRTRTRISMYLFYLTLRGLVSNPKRKSTSCIQMN